ncbi:MAG: hypothetical protein JWN13_2458 [Betaproteobacteria bacterium]|jgi:hypothetical protein|nr:hypothetical protein [Betaproteobacteria bacterium]
MTRTVGTIAFLFLYLASTSASAAEVSCAGVDPSASAPLKSVSTPPSTTCKPRVKKGYPVPDPTCTPGAVNPTLTLDVLTDHENFRTSCVRDGATSKTEKNGTYDWYKIKHPAKNVGKTQTCELDHLISIELGGADTVDNIWPQCGPKGVVRDHRYFHQKDLVENWLAREVRAGRIELEAAQRGIASDWTQFIARANKACKPKKCIGQKDS